MTNNISNTPELNIENLDMSIHHNYKYRDNLHQTRLVQAKSDTQNQSDSLIFNDETKPFTITNNDPEPVPNSSPSSEILSPMVVPDSPTLISEYTNYSPPLDFNNLDNDYYSSSTQSQYEIESLLPSDLNYVNTPYEDFYYNLEYLTDANPLNLQADSEHTWPDINTYDDFTQQMFAKYGVDNLEDYEELMSKLNRPRDWNISPADYELYLENNEFTSRAFMEPVSVTPSDLRLKEEVDDSLDSDQEHVSFPILPNFSGESHSEEEEGREADPFINVKKDSSPLRSPRPRNSETLSGNHSETPLAGFHMDDLLFTDTHQNHLYDELPNRIRFDVRRGAGDDYDYGANYLLEGYDDLDLDDYFSDLSGLKETGLQIAGLTESDPKTTVSSSSEVPAPAASETTSASSTTTEATTSTFSTTLEQDTSLSIAPTQAQPTTTQKPQHLPIRVELKQQSSLASIFKSELLKPDEKIEEKLDRSQMHSSQNSRFGILNSLFEEEEGSQTEARDDGVTDKSIVDDVLRFIIMIQNGWDQLSAYVAIKFF